jgi:hypothetical protein
MNIDYLTNDQLVDIILNPAWWEPEASVFHNLWSNLEFVGMDANDERYDVIIDLAESQYKESLDVEDT